MATSIFFSRKQRAPLATRFPIDSSLDVLTSDHWSFHSASIWNFIAASSAIPSPGCHIRLRDPWTGTIPASLTHLDLSQSVLSLAGITFADPRSLTSLKFGYMKENAPFLQSLPALRVFSSTSFCCADLSFLPKTLTQLGGILTLHQDFEELKRGLTVWNAKTFRSRIRERFLLHVPLEGIQVNIHCPTFAPTSQWAPVEIDAVKAFAKQMLQFWPKPCAGCLIGHLDSINCQRGHRLWTEFLEGDLV